MDGPNVPLNYSIDVQAWEWILPHHFLTVTLDKTQNLPDLSIFIGIIRI